MRLSKGRVAHLADAVVRSAEEAGQIEATEARQSLIARLERAITDELMIEDRLHAEIRELMKQYQTEIERGRVDYQKMFTMIKNKLVRERGLIL